MTKPHFNLRDYQRECIAAIPEAGRYLIHMATGLGKTVTFSQIPRRGRMLILSHREELVWQPRKYFDCSYGVEQAGHSSAGEEVVSASVQSIVRRLKRFEPNAFDVIVTDEAHHAAAPTYGKIYEHFAPRLHLGFTATPNRNDGIGLEQIYEDIIFERDLEWGIKNGYLSDIHCLRVDIEYDLRHVATRMGDYAVNELDKAVNIESANKAVADAYKRYAVGPTLIFACSVAHAQALASAIPGAVAVVGGEERSKTVDDFAAGKIPCLVNCMVFTEGTDLPNICTVIIARPTKNIALYTQMVGRGTRLHPGKKKLTLIDCVGNDVNICEAPTLIGLDPKIVDGERTTANLFELPEVVNKIWDKPEHWIKNVEYVDIWAKKRKYRTHDVAYFRFPDGTLRLSSPAFTIPPEDSMGRTLWNGKKTPTQRVLDEVYQSLREYHGDKRALWDRSEVKRWGAYQATQKQMELVKRFWPEAPQEMTKLDAGQIISRCFARR